MIRSLSPRRRPALVLLAGLILAIAELLGEAGPSHAEPLIDGGFTTNAAVSPARVPPGGAVSLSATITAAAASVVQIDIEVVGPAGAAHQQVFESQAFGVEQTRAYPVTWQTPATALSGAYQVKIGVFGPGWATLLHWNDRAASFAVGAPVAAPAPAEAPPLPAGWPRTLQIGVADGPGGAAALRATAPVGFRYQYLTGGVNTSSGWATWNPDGSFVSGYVEESARQGIIPVLSYYQIFHSLPGDSRGEAEAVFTNLQTPATMRAYYEDLRLFFQRASEFPATRVVLHVEPDMWGFMQQRADGDNAASVPVAVAAGGLPELADLPNTLPGFARAVMRLRDSYAPNVWLGYHLSVWGTGTDIGRADPPDTTVDALGARAGAFYHSLHSRFDIAFAEFADRDAGFYQHIRGDGGGWWDADDFARHARFITGFVQAGGPRVVLWQIPLGNTVMRAANNSWNHFQDNRVERLLADPARALLNDYVRAGVVALLFGRGAEGATCACDAAGDGVTNPAPINGNARPSLNADDDGGYFREQVGAYYAGGVMPLP